MDYSKEFKKFAIKHQGVNSLYYDQIVSSMTPYIIEERQLNVAQMDVFSRLMMDRIIFLGTAINDSIANIIQAQLLFLESVDKEKDIQIYINSPGGSVYAGLGIYDTMQFIGPDVSTICTGIAASMAAVLLCAGKEGKRSGLTHSRVMIHQPLGGAQGQASDIEITAREIGKFFCIAASASIKMLVISFSNSAFSSFVLINLSATPASLSTTEPPALPNSLPNILLITYQLYYQSLPFYIL